MDSTSVRQELKAASLFIFLARIIRSMGYDVRADDPPAIPAKATAQLRLGNIVPNAKHSMLSMN